MKFLNKKGNVLLLVVVAMTAISALGTGIYFMTTTATFSGLDANDQNRAYQIAVAGRDYALTKNLGNTASLYPSGRDFTYANGDKFRLVISGDTITSTGIIREGTPYEAKRTITVTKTGFSRQADISLEKDRQFFTEPAASQTGFITNVIGTDQTPQISLGQTSMPNTFGALWYKGSAAAGNCASGRCEFGTGFRAFFVFKFDPASTGEGFTFTFFNGDLATNDFYSVGGDTNKGELMAYAGDSRTATSYLDFDNRTAAGCPGLLGCAKGRGIQPPKMAIEFDPLPNRTSTDVCASGSRDDGTRNHVGYVFWGSNADNLCGSTVGKNTYDDNRHNAGNDTTSDPRNSRRLGLGADPSYYTASATTWGSNWLLGYLPNIYAVRIEVTRRLKAGGAGEGEYIVNSWVKHCAVDLACTTFDDTSSFVNTKVDYAADAPTLTRTLPVVLESTLHQKFNTFFFGWTTATSAAAQNILINRFRINFKN